MLTRTLASLAVTLGLGVALYCTIVVAQPGAAVAFGTAALAGYVWLRGQEAR